ncbi:MAG: phosphoglycerate kinase, partial [Planctomycetota bacterium]|nr:phosphoglycerate kinase [Planctomycetota bacterium]
MIEPPTAPEDSGTKMALKTIEDIDVKGKCVLMRTDFNVPMTPDNRVANNFRITQAIPSIRSVIERGGRLVLMSHLGRPDGSGFVERHSLKPVAEELGSLLGDLAPDGV